MIWAPPALAGFAHTAGFRGRTLMDAVAIALASSDGDDALQRLGPSGMASDTRGLWQIDVIRLPYFDGINLYDPTKNATAAFQLWEANDRGWEWNYAYKAGTWKARLPEAAEGTTAASRRQPASLIPPGLVDTAALSRQAPTMRATVGAIIDGIRALTKVTY